MEGLDVVTQAAPEVRDRYAAVEEEGECCCHLVVKGSERGECGVGEGGINMLEMRLHQYKGESGAYGNFFCWLACRS